MPVSSYDGTDGVADRDDLGGLNLSTVPKVLIECGNMRNATDAALLVSPAWQQQAARAIAAGITTLPGLTPFRVAEDDGLRAACPDQSVRTPRASLPACMSSTISRNPSSGRVSVTSSSSMSLPLR